MILVDGSALRRTYEKVLHFDYVQPFLEDADQLRFVERLNHTMTAALAQFVAELPRACGSACDDRCPERVGGRASGGACTTAQCAQAIARALGTAVAATQAMCGCACRCVGRLVGISSWDWDRPPPERLVDDSTFYALMDVIQSNEGTAAAENCQGAAAELF